LSEPTSVTVKVSPLRWNSACRRETVTSSRKISLSGCRPACTTSSSRRNREPEPGPRCTTSSACPEGSMLAGALLGVGWATGQPKTFSATASVALTPVPKYLAPLSPEIPPSAVTIDTDAQLLHSTEVVLEARLVTVGE